MTSRVYRERKGVKGKRVVKRKTPALTPDVVTRDMLADLRDEIEDLLRRCENEIVNTRERVTRLRKAYDENNRALEVMNRQLDDVKTVLGFDQSDPNAPVLSEPVPWSYFHVWIARINESLKRLEDERK